MAKNESRVAPAHRGRGTMSETPAGRHLQDICTFGRVGLHTSRRRAADAPAPLERAPSSERGVAGQLPRPARRSKKGACAAGTRGLRGRAARGGTSRRSCSFIILDGAASPPSTTLRRYCRRIFPPYHLRHVRGAGRAPGRKHVHDALHANWCTLLGCL